ncbi:MAG: beta-lactamase family protein [Gammaproteobacteria bacterium]|nr:beta-lactamase family protein [Gammaproteobacteria bacterium]
MGSKYAVFYVHGAGVYDGYAIHTFTLWLFGTQNCFGHMGAMSSSAFADRDSGLSVAILTNENRSPMDAAKRMISISQALKKACDS